MSSLSSLHARNNAISLNPVVANIDLSVHGSDFLWAVFAIMISSALGLIILGSTRPVGQRAFHQLAAVICFTASIAYFSMASDLGGTPIPVEFIRGGTLGANWVAVGVAHPTRSIWYARYIDWVVTTPLLLLELLLSTGLPLSEIFTVLFFDEVMIITGLIGALVSSSYKWGFFTFGCAAEFYIWWILLGPARTSASRLGNDFASAYRNSAVILSVLWLLYPVAWGVADGGNVITTTSEMIFYGILDVLAKPVFCFYHCFAISKLDYTLLAFSSGKISDGATDRLLDSKHSGARGTPDHTEAPPFVAASAPTYTAPASDTHVHHAAPTSGNTTTETSAPHVSPVTGVATT